MATATRKAAPTLVVAWQSFAADGVAFERGTRLRGDHEAVRAHPELFVPDGLPEDEWPSPWTQIVAADAAAVTEAPPPPPPRIALDTPLRDLRVCTTEVIASTAGACGAGHIVAADDPLVAAAPEAFRPFHETL